MKKALLKTSFLSLLMSFIILTHPNAANAQSDTSKVSYILRIYLVFEGNCSQAMEFYKDCLGGELLTMKKFKESKMKVPKANMDKVMFAEFKAPGIYFMASDNIPGKKVIKGNNVTLSFDFKDENSIDNAFRKMSKGGKILMPLKKSEWGSKFGMLVDKYGITWMFNYNKG